MNGVNGLKDAGQLVRDHFIHVTDRDVLDVHQPAADFVHRVILMNQNSIRELVEMRQCQNRVVVLHDHL